MDCPIGLDNNKKYTITGNDKNILTKIEKDGWIGILCENELEKYNEHRWKIKILKTQNNYIRVGVVPKDYDINTSDNYSCGWCFYNYNCYLYSGPPLNYNKGSNLNQIKNEVEIVINMTKDTGALKFIIDNEDKGCSYTDIPLDKHLVPVVFLYSANDSVEVIKY